MSVQNEILKLVTYGLNRNLIEVEDKIYTINQYMDLFEIDNMEEVTLKIEDENLISLENILEKLVDYAYQKGIIKNNSPVYRELFDTKIMGVMVPKPSQVIGKFRKIYKLDPKKATDYYYKLAHDSDYIRSYRVCKDMRWKINTEYGDLDISINLSKPEKDPKAIAEARNVPKGNYPLCLLCKENEGYAGRVNYPARQNLRIIPIKIDNSKWFFQYSPYSYFNEHCIVFNSEHNAMKIERATFVKLLDFVDQFPHYFIGSNSELPIVGGSILSHNHFQGGNYEFAMAQAPIEIMLSIKNYYDISIGIVKWPMSVIRIKGKKKERLVDLADHILKKWRNYTDEQAFIYAMTDGQMHNTITPIARKRNGEYELDLVLRNNITTQKYPMGVYHPHQSLHHIKKENIGLIEVMGFAVFPARLKDEMELIKQVLLYNQEPKGIESIKKHIEWMKEIQKKYVDINKKNVDNILKNEMGSVFLQVLKDAGVYKCDNIGRNNFLRFLNIL